MKIFTRIVTWLGIMAALTLLAMGLWLILLGGSQSTESLKWLQFAQMTATFLLPPIVCAWIWDEHHQPCAWLQIDKGADWMLFVLGIGMMVCAVPAINLLADLNSRIELPECLASIEQMFKQQEAAAAVLTERFLKADHWCILLLNIGLMAILPAFAEELSFRGTLQQVLAESQESKVERQKHIAIWVTAFIFSAIHMQFYGFVPRMLMGALFGYLFVWSGSLWIPIVMHFVNNGLAVVAYYVLGQNNSADTIGTGTTWWLGVVSLMITSLGLLIFYRRTRTR